MTLGLRSGLEAVVIEMHNGAMLRVPQYGIRSEVGIALQFYCHVLFQIDRIHSLKQDDRAL
jgi:hypothetical protein